MDGWMLMAVVLLFYFALLALIPAVIVFRALQAARRWLEKVFAGHQQK